MKPALRPQLRPTFMEQHRFECCGCVPPEPSSDPRRGTAIIQTFQMGKLRTKNPSPQRELGSFTRFHGIATSCHFLAP